MSKPSVLVNLLQALVAIILGNVVYYALLPSLPLAARHHRFQFDLGFSSLGVVADERLPRADCVCQRSIGRNDQARAYRSVSHPDHWPQALRIRDDRMPP